MLPVIEKPIYETNLIDGKTIKFTPFTVKESKLLMMAKESGELKSMVDALRQILTNCLVEPIDVTKLPMVDLEWLFLQIHSKSSGEVVPVVYKCRNKVEGKECGMLIEFSIDLTKIQVTNKDVNKRVMLSDHVGMEMKFPTYEATIALIEAPEDQQDEVLAAHCVDYIFDTKANTTHKAEEIDKQELLTFIKTLPLAKYHLVEQFLESSPTIRETVEKKCGKCGHQHKIELEGLSDFFV